MNPNISALRKKALAGDHEAIAALRDLALQVIATLDSLTSVPAGHPEIPEDIRAGVDAAHEVAKRSLRWPVAWDAIQEIREPHLGKVLKDKKQDGTGRIGKMGIGSKVGIRVDKRPGAGRPRDFGPHGISGFGLNVWQELETERTSPNREPHIADKQPKPISPKGENWTWGDVLSESQLVRRWEQLAAILPPLAADTLESWVNAGTKLCESWTEELRLEEHPTIPDLQRIRKIPHWNRFPWIQPIKSKASEKQQTLDGATTPRGVRASIPGKVRESLRSLLP